MELTIIVQIILICKTQVNIIPNLISYSLVCLIQVEVSAFFSGPTVM